MVKGDPDKVGALGFVGVFEPRLRSLALAILDEARAPSAGSDLYADLLGPQLATLILHRRLTIINNQGDDRFEYLGVGDSEIINFDYTTRSAQGSFGEATAVLAVEGANDAPFADFLTPDLVSISETETATFNVLDDAFDPDETDVLQVITIDGLDLVDGVITVAGEDGGQFNLMADGDLTFDPLTFSTSPRAKPGPSASMM